MRLFASLAVLVPLVISAVLAPVKAQTVQEEIFDQVGIITDQLTDTAVVATEPLTNGTFSVLVNSINALTVSLQKLKAIVDLTPTLEADQATPIVDALLLTVVPIFARTAAQIVEAKADIVAIGHLQDAVASLAPFVKATVDTFAAFVGKLPATLPQLTTQASNFKAAIDAESAYIAKTYLIPGDF